ncbi:MAG: hypothetical protein ACYTJ0_13655 [Planctomycetota bacterium]|jgi:hypothetical protein
MKKKTLSSLAALVAATAGAGYFATSSLADKGTQSPTLGSGAESNDAIDADIAFGGMLKPDVTTSRLGLASSGSSDDFNYYGSFLASGQPETERVRAYAMGSTSCNIGDDPAEWIDSHSGSTAGKHPVIMPNIYRYLDGRLEHVGMGWGKHSFCAVTYWAGLNGAQGDLGPRSQVNPWTEVGVPTHTTYSTPSTIGQNSQVAGRLQVKQGVIDETNDNDGRWVAEIHYLTHDEQFADRFNNASWREVVVNSTSIVGVGSGQGSVNFQEPGIFAWNDFDDQVIIKAIDVPNDGRMYLGYRVFDNGDGTWRYEYALYNMNSDRSAASFSVPVDDSVTASSMYFHDVDYHSGDGASYPQNYDGTDWAVSEGGGALNWSTDSFTTNTNANALRWSTLYNFSFVADAPPTFGEATIGLYKPGDQDTVSIAALVPDIGSGDPCPEDIDGNGDVDVDDLIAVILAWGNEGDDPADIDGSGLVDVDDLVAVILAWGPCN